MVKKQEIICTLLQLLVPVLVEGVIFSADPSSYNLTCNPYGSKIQLPCTVQEPQDLNSHLLSVLWFWSKTNDDGEVINACHISSRYQCNMLVDNDKYDFIAKRTAVEISQEEGITPIRTFNRIFDLKISNISVIDTGCYHCRVWLNGEQMDKASGVFCLKEESAYQHLPPCSNDTVTAPTNTITPLSHSESRSLNNDSFINTNMDPIDYVTAFYVTMVVGAILMITTCILAIVVVCFTVECFKKSKRVPYNNSLKGCSTVMDTYRKSEERLRKYKQIQPEAAKTTLPMPQLGIYCLAEKDESSTTSTQRHSKGIYESKIIPPSKPQYNKTPSLSLESPGSHIYQTLDKDFFEELEKMTTTEEESEDPVFDDPNYSSLRNSQISSISSSVPAMLHKSTNNADIKLGGIIYDKLKPKQLDLEYSYAYLHISGHQQRTKSENSDDILHIAEMGYEMDPKIVSTLMREAQQTNDGANSSDGAAVHGYQSLDHAKLTPRNSYASTLMRKE